MNFGLVQERLSNRGDVIQAFRLTQVFGADRQVVIDTYDARREIEAFGSLERVDRLNQLKLSIHDFLKAAHGVLQDSWENKDIELDLSEEIGELSKMLLDEFPLMKKPLAEFEAKNYLWHLRKN